MLSGNKRDKQTILQLYDKILPSLAGRINSDIAGVIPMFHNYGLERQVNTWSGATAAGAAEEVSIEKGNVQQLGLKLRLEGFDRAGIPPFDVYKELVFRLEQDHYLVGPNNDTTWLEKQYGQDWSKNEYDDIATRWSGELVDEITKQLEKLT
ncbi:hypothetical protein [Botryobacter ruber]|uniref:hypothetical protein n=1 Tax=Botryobacter ruber TaxID=2171629 RepID=UPI000E0C24B1|nr:hypothetical protein [Botryobacter ruber]